MSDALVVSAEERRQGLTSVQTHLELYNTWYSRLHEYTGIRKLTKPSDKLPALSGIATYLAKLTNDKYLAGLWAGDLCRGLLWQRDAIHPYRRIHPPRGPSWSWVNFDSGIRFKANKNLRVDKATIEIIECSTTVKGDSPFGEVTGGKLVLRAIVQELTESFLKSLRRTTQPFERCIFDYEDFSETSPMWGKRNVLMLVAKTTDTSPHPFPPQPVQISVFGIQMPTINMGTPNREQKDVIQSLILREVDGQPDVFERIGQCTLDEMDNSCEPGEEDEKVEQRIQILTII